MNEPTSTTVPPDNQTNLNTFHSQPEFRWCYYLHLHTAKETAERWRENDGSSHPVFAVRGKKRPVFVRGYFHVKATYGGDWCLVYPVTSKDTLLNGKKKPNFKPFGKLLSDDPRNSFVQTIPERYPLSLLESADKQPIQGVDRMTVTAVCKILDSVTYHGT